VAAAVKAKPRLVITAGDPGGIGPELVRRALADPGIRGLAEFTVTGPAGPDAVPVGRPSAAGGRAAVAAVREAVALLADGAADALVTAPVSKEALQLAGYPWPGQTEMLAGLCGASDLRVLLMAGPLRVVHVVAADPGRRSRLRGQRGRADGVGGPRCCHPCGARGRGTARRHAACRRAGRWRAAC
jgi:4-hydroxy-L-threonine phosphate dehydrogenase PdxA